MDEIIKKNKELLNKLKEVNKNLTVEEQLINLLNIKNEILKFDIQYKQLLELTNICNDINKQNKELFNCNILKIKNKIKNNDENIDNIQHNNIYIDYKTTIDENKEEKYNNIINLPVIFVDTEDEIQNSPLYYVKKTKQFGLKINNNLLMGNIGNIYNKKQPKRKKTKKCNKLFCNKDDCYYYHDNDRNFMNYSWTHSTSYKTPQTKK